MWEAEDVDLRVRLDYCERADGLVLFRGSPFTGIGVAVGDEDVRDGRAAGVVSMWRYAAGRRVGAWVEPWFAMNHGTILDAAGRFESNDGFGSVIFRDQRLTGLEASFEGPFLVAMSEIFDGEPQPRACWWRPDGSIHRMQAYTFVETSGGLVQVRQSASWGDSEAGPAISEPATTVSLGMIRGEMKVLARVESQFDGDDFSPPTFTAFKKSESRYHASSFGIGLDNDRRISRLRMTGPDHFEGLGSAGIDPEPISWLPSSVAELADFDVSRELDFHMDAACADLVLAALGGALGLHPVERITAPTYDLRPDQVAMFLGLPSLVHVAFFEHERYQDPARAIRSLCQQFKNRNPHAFVALDSEVLEARNVAILDDLG